MDTLRPLALILPLVFSSQAIAGPSGDETRSFSLTMSPVHLIITTMEVTGEFCLAPRHGLAGILGAGVPLGVPVFEAGASYRFYVLGDFDTGMQLGAELLAAGGAYRSTSAMLISPSGFLGGKFTSSAGFTLDGQFGLGTLDGEVSILLNF